MKRYMMQLSYIGSQYRGSQKHIYNNMVDSDSIQGKIENILLKSEPKFENKPKLVMAGRTDAGVHALCTTAHVDLVFPKSETFVIPKYNLKIEPIAELQRSAIVYNRDTKFDFNQMKKGVNLFAGFHKISEEDIINMLQVPSHKNWNPHVQLAPPYGLYLLKVNYDNTDIQDISILK
ncbi:PREDICTED: uncharacterized protein LOC105361716 [Ceratosolen solmsi marchali]|uniref:Uncharacterized protein LOC105361716 n=1 Tax=Ceratosolen solmsi marchali TaxID=326594 RepID=A0AAJ6YFT6_9HYME|nr:PREDICTED: uncharacterized protein LOC105361716 [Ceratosolen solmsi marchali]